VFDKWIEYEAAQKDIKKLCEVYTTAVSLPTKEIQRLYTSFQEFASGHSVREIVDDSEMNSLTVEVRTSACFHVHALLVFSLYHPGPLESIQRKTASEACAR
jgi:hypothetical protein